MTKRVQNQIDYIKFVENQINEMSNSIAKLFIEETERLLPVSIEESIDFYAGAVWAFTFFAFQLGSIFEKDGTKDLIMISHFAFTLMLKRRLEMQNQSQSEFPSEIQ